MHQKGDCLVQLLLFGMPPLFQAATYLNFILALQKMNLLRSPFRKSY